MVHIPDTIGFVTSFSTKAARNMVCTKTSAWLWACYNSDDWRRSEDLTVPRVRMKAIIRAELTKRGVSDIRSTVARIAREVA